MDKYNVAFFEDLQEALRFANDPIRRENVIGVYGGGKTFQKHLKEELDLKRMTKEEADKMVCCVLW